MAEQGKDTLSILVDVRSRLDELVQSQKEFVKLRQEVNSTGNMLRTGFGIDVARRSIDILKNTTREYLLQSYVMADQIEDQAKNLEMSNRAYQVFGNLLKDAGGDVSQLTQTVSTNNRSLVEARNVASAAAGAYRQLGLDVAELEQLPFERRMERISRAVAAATDRSAAFSAASQILGTRNLPTLLGALRDVAEQGWDKLAASQERAGRVMTDDTIRRLAEARKELEKFNQRGTIFAGEAIGGGMLFYDTLKEAIQNDPQGLARAISGQFADTMLTPWRLFTGDTSLTRYLAGRVAPAAGTPELNGDGGAARKRMELTQARLNAESALAQKLLERQTVEANPNLTDTDRKERLVKLLKEELDLRMQLLRAAAAEQIDGEDPAARELRLKKLEAEITGTRNSVFGGLQNPAARQYAESRDRFGLFNDVNAQPDTPGIRQGMGMGAMDWVTGLGTQGQQAADMLQSTLGQTVRGISSGIYGWATGTQSFGSAMLELGDSIFRSFLDTIIQMGVQWLVTQALIKTGMISTHVLGEGLRVQRMTATAAEGTAATASMAPAAATASISSFGMAAALGVAALIAAMAIFGGFATGGYTGNGPVDQVAGVVHGQEGVLNAAAMRRLGVENLNALNAGRALSAAAAPAVISGEGGSGLAAPRVYVLMDRAQFARAMQEDSRAWFQDMSATYARKNT